MCGIIGVVRRRSTREPPPLDPLVAELEAVIGLLSGRPSEQWSADALRAGATALAGVDVQLRGVPGVRALLEQPAAALRLADHADRVGTILIELEAALDADAVAIAPGELEALNAALLTAKDALWALRCDRLRTAGAVAALAGPIPFDATSRAAIEAFTSVQVALSAIDRLEVRGRDSAGLHLLVRGHGLDLTAPELAALCAARGGDRLFVNRSVRCPDGLLSFVYKAAAEIGELGDNTRHLRAAITGDELLHRAVASEAAEVVVLGHTRWASVGIISEANAHPLNQEWLSERGHHGGDGPYVVGALNGDVDNFADLIVAENLSIAPEITTDAKIIPTLMSKYLLTETRTAEAFRRTVAGFEGSVAIAAATGLAPQRLQLALRGSGPCSNLLGSN